MANSLYQQFGQPNFLQQFQNFKQSFQGDPQQVLQELLNSGKVSQQQYNQAMQQAMMLRKMLNI